LLAVNVAGIMYVCLPDALELNRRITDELSPHRGEYVLLNKSIFQCDGFFDRFGIKQKFANPEAASFSHSVWGNRPGHTTDRPLFGSDIAFAEDLPPMPSSPVYFRDEGAAPWLAMSEGLFFYDPEEKATFTSPFAVNVPKGYWNYAPKIKFYMKVEKEPEGEDGDFELALTASPRGEPQKMEVYANNRRLGEWVWDQPGSSENTIIIPKAVLDESSRDEMRLLTIMFYMFYLSDADTPNISRPRPRPFGLMFEKMEFRERKAGL
jgi:hypothetical protein